MVVLLEGASPTDEEGDAVGDRGGGLQNDRHAVQEQVEGGVVVVETGALTATEGLLDETRRVDHRSEHRRRRERCKTNRNISYSHNVRKDYSL